MPPPILLMISLFPKNDVKSQSLGSWSKGNDSDPYQTLESHPLISIMRQFRGHVHVDLHRYIDMYKLYLCLCLCSSSSQPKLYKLHNLPSSSGPKIHVDLMSMSMFKSTYTY